MHCAAAGADEDDSGTVRALLVNDAGECYNRRRQASADAFKRDP